MNARFICINRAKMWNKAMWEIYDTKSRKFLGNLFAFKLRKTAKEKCKLLNSWRILICNFTLLLK